jgi:hypothetical protein
MADTVVFRTEIETNADEALDKVDDSLDAVREAAAGSLNALKSMQASLKNLAGDSLEVVKAQDQLKQAIGAESMKLAQLELAAIAAGTSLGDLAAAHAEQQKESEDAAKALEKERLAAQKLAKTMPGASDAIAAFGGPVGDAAKKVEGLTEKFGTLATAEGAVAGATAGAAAVIALFVAGVAYGAAELGRFVLASANVARSMQLTREAAVGSAEGATALGTQVDALARKLPTAKGELNELASSLARSGIGGKTLVDAFNAIGQAAAANGQAAGAQIQNLIERSKNLKRFSLGRFELQGTGLARDDVAAQLAKKLKTDIGSARQALAEGRVSLADGAEAMRKAVEEKFGKINAKKVLEFSTIFAKAKEELADLGAGVDLAPMAEALGDITAELGKGTVTGKALRELMTTFGNGLVDSFKASAPFIKGFFTGLVLLALDLGIAYYDVKDAILDVVGDDVLEGFDGVENGILAAKLAAGALAVVLAAAAVGVGIAVAAIAGPFILIGAAIAGVIYAGVKLYEWFQETDFGQLGTDMIDGLVNALKAGVGRVRDGVVGLAEGAKAAFKKSMGIASPSKVFAEYGAFTADGFVDGVEGGSGDANAAVDSMVSVPEGGASGSGGQGGGGSTTVNLTINTKSDGAELAARLTDDGVLDALVRAIEKALASQSLTVEVAI